MTLTQLEYIVAVDQYGSFSQAAEACFVTQPTLSMQIKKLEDYLGVMIFDRSKQPVIPTEVGRPLIEQARVVLTESRKLDEIIKTHQNTISGELKVGIIPTLAPYLLPRFAGELVRSYPQVSLIIREWQTDEIVKALRKDLIDVAIIVTPLNEDGLEELPLFYEEILVYTNPTYKFEKQLEVKIQDIQSPDIWLLSDGHCFRDQVINLCSYNNKVEHNLPITYNSGSLETLRKLVDREGGFTLLPELAVAEFDEDALERVRTFSDQKPVREISLVYARNFAKASLVKALGEVIRNNVPQDMLQRERGNVVGWK
ncbi:hydrogen peroxide-inducible genes activator [Limibacter armeniacum]|uniref:hydrogen peroxide-inducible genes activator n=1 Tax=Limibacter armeniacum TaxID=466084 RepID=UPI002FE52C15